MDESQVISQDELKAEVVNLTGGMIDTVEAETVHISRGGASRIVAKEAEIHQGGAAVLQGDNIAIHQGAAIAIRGGQVMLENGSAVAVITADLSLAGSRTGLSVADRVNMENSSSVILLAREINGPVETVLDTRGALLAGLVSGIGVGLVLTVLRMLTRRR